MKNSMLRMASKGAPMQKNYAGSPLANNDEDEKVKKGDENKYKKSPNAYDPDDAKNKSRSDTVTAGIYQHHFNKKSDKEKFPTTVKLGKEAEKRLKGYQVTEEEINRQHNTPSFKSFKERIKKFLND